MTNYVGTNQHHFALVQGTAEVTLIGGTIRGAKTTNISGDAQFAVLDSGKLTLSGTTLIDSTFAAIRAANSATVTVRDKSLIDNVGESSILLADTARLDIVDSAIMRSPSAAIYMRTAGTPTITLEKAKINESKLVAIAAEVYSDASPTVRIVDSEIKSNQTGLFFNYAVRLDIAGSTILDSGHPTLGCGSGIYLNGGSAANSVKIRTSTIRGNCASGISIVGGGAGSTYDLGTKAAPGGNTFVGNNPSGIGGGANLHYGSPTGVTLQAIGNTWSPGQQGAAAANSVTPPPGQFAAPAQVSGAVDGINFKISGSGAATTVIRLAE